MVVPTWISVSQLLFRSILNTLGYSREKRVPFHARSPSTEIGTTEFLELRYPQKAQASRICFESMRFPLDETAGAHLGIC